MGHHWSKCLGLIREEPGGMSHRRKKVGGGKALREAAAYTQFVLIEPRETALLTLKNRSQIQTLRNR